MLKERATLPFQMIKISSINTAWTVTSETEMESWSQKDMSQKDKKYKTLYFLFSCFNAQQYCLVISNMSKAIFSPYWSFLGAHLHWKSFCRIWHLFLRFTYTIWFLKASNLDFIALNTNNLPKKSFFLIFYQYPISFFDAVWSDQ